MGVGDESLDNVKLVSDFMHECEPQNVVVEMCDERFNASYNDVMKHPKYEVLMSKFYKVLDDKEKATKLSEKSNLIELKGLEYLIGIDICSFRLSKCRSVLGDRNWSITQKRMKAKQRLSNILEQDDTDNIMTMDMFMPPEQAKQAEVEDLKREIAKDEDVEEDEDEEFDFTKVKKDTLEKEKKSYDEIYNEVFIDEINQELLKNIHKWEGEIVNVLLDDRRMKSFETLWKNTYEEHYKDLDRKEKMRQIEEKHLKKAAENA